MPLLVRITGILGHCGLGFLIAILAFAFACVLALHRCFALAPALLALAPALVLVALPRSLALQLIREGFANTFPITF